MDLIRTSIFPTFCNISIMFMKNLQTPFTTDYLQVASDKFAQYRGRIFLFAKPGRDVLRQIETMY